MALRVLVSLGVVIGAIWFVQRRVSRGSGRSTRAGKPMAVIARQNLGPKASVAVIEFGGKRFLLGVTEHGIAVLDDSPAEELLAIEAPAPEAGPALVAATRRASSKQNSRDFAHALGQAATAGPLPKPVPVRPARNDLFNATFPQSSSKLAGSVFSATTWKQAWLAVRGGR